MSNAVIHTMPVPIESGSEVPQVLRDRGVTDEVFAGYLSDVRTAYDDVHGSEGKVVMISMLVVLVITIPFVLRYFSKNAKEMNRRMAEINRGLEPYGVCGTYRAVQSWARDTSSSARSECPGCHDRRPRLSN